MREKEESYFFLGQKEEGRISETNKGHTFHSNGKIGSIASLFLVIVVVWIVDWAVTVIVIIIFCVVGRRCCWNNIFSHLSP